MHWHGRRSLYGGSVGPSVDVGVDGCEMDVAAGQQGIVALASSFN
jgi:hypothetical protein